MPTSYEYEALVFQSLSFCDSSLSLLEDLDVNATCYTTKKNLLIKSAVCYLIEGVWCFLEEKNKDLLNNTSCTKLSLMAAFNKNSKANNTLRSIFIDKNSWLYILAEIELSFKLKPYEQESSFMLQKDSDNKPENVIASSANRELNVYHWHNITPDDVRKISKDFESFFLSFIDLNAEF